MLHLRSVAIEPGEARSGAAARAVAWADLESVRLVRDFLNAPERFLRHL